LAWRDADPEMPPQIDAAPEALARLPEAAPPRRPLESSERSLATVLFTDIVGSTECASEIGDSAWRTLPGPVHGRAPKSRRPQC
jgi:class 3 adenylate cyclase